MRYILMLVVGLSSLLYGCATPYQEMGLRGGVVGTRLDDTIFEVRSSGNGFTGTDTIYRHGLRKAAEMSLAAGCKYFVAINNTSQSFNVGVSGNSTVNEGLSLLNGKLVYFMNGATYNVIKPSTYKNTFACFNNKPTALIPGLIFNAKYVIEDLSKVFEGPVGN
ncbi:CC0125/CC1285 family lipoprotein [Avibacterium paragallinarum]|uniref:CC0125/CC1285 family lipoprotein n=1 Tax=Avibacterium paragallinarum TaxID=728 RepID=UPI003979F0EA